MKLEKSINKFFKKAVEVDEWVPPEIKTPLEAIEKIEKDPRLINFRVELPKEQILYKLSDKETLFFNDYNKNIAFISTALGYCISLINTIEKFSFYGEDEKEELNKIQHKAQLWYDNIENFTTNIKAENFVLNKFTQKNGNEIKLMKFYENARHALENILHALVAEERFILSYGGTKKLSTAQRVILKDRIIAIERVYNKVKPLSDLSNLKNWENRLSPGKRPEENDKLYVVFTTNYKDIYGMSSRSEWTSCVDLFSEQYPWLPKKVIGACFSKTVGIIYITNGENYKGRGERMLHRSQVFLVLNKMNNQQTLFIQQVYPQKDSKIAGIFKDALEKHLNMPAVVGTAEFAEKVVRMITPQENLYPGPQEDIRIKTELDNAALLDQIKNIIYRADLIISVYQTDMTRVIDEIKEYRPDLIKTDLSTNEKLNMFITNATVELEIVIKRYIMWLMDQKKDDAEFQHLIRSFRHAHYYNEFLEKIIEAVLRQTNVPIEQFINNTCQEPLKTIFLKYCRNKVITDDIHIVL